MADFIYFYRNDSKTSIVDRDLQLALQDKFYSLTFFHPGWIQATLKKFLSSDSAKNSLCFLQDTAPDAEYFASDSNFSTAKILRNVRMAKPEEFGLNTDNQHLHHFWQLDVIECHQAANVISQTIDSALVQRLDPSSLLGEYAYADTPTKRDQLKVLVDPLQQSDADSTTYFLHALNSLHELLVSVKKGEFILIDSVEYVPVVGIED